MTTQQHKEALSVVDTLKLALEALQDNQHLVADNERHAYVMEYNDLIEKCKEALNSPDGEAQPEQVCGFDVVLDESMPTNTFKLVQPEQRNDSEQQEPVFWWNGGAQFAAKKSKEWDKRTGGTTAFGCDIPLYTTPQQRTAAVGEDTRRAWVGLTDEEINEVLGGDIQDEPSGLLEFVRAIEAKLKEKNERLEKNTHEHK